MAPRHSCHQIRFMLMCPCIINDLFENDGRCYRKLSCWTEQELTVRVQKSTYQPDSSALNLFFITNWFFIKRRLKENQPDTSEHPFATHCLPVVCKTWTCPPVLPTFGSKPLFLVVLAPVHLTPCDDSTWKAVVLIVYELHSPVQFEMTGAACMYTPTRNISSKLYYSAPCSSDTVILGLWNWCSRGDYGQY